MARAVIVKRTIAVAVAVILVGALVGWWFASTSAPALKPVASSNPMATANSRSGSGAVSSMARVAESLPPSGIPLVQIYEPLKALAQQGNAAAACRLAFELDRC